MYRLFVALRPPVAMRRMLLERMGGVPEARWQDDEQLHVTLRFIGEVDGNVAEEIACALQTVTGPQPTLIVDGIGTFERRGFVHTIWARVMHDAALIRLQKRIERALSGQHMPAAGRSFVPHITLARLSRPDDGVGAFVASNAALRIASSTLDAFNLYESVLGSGGSTYHAIARYPLTGTSGLVDDQAISSSR